MIAPSEDPRFIAAVDLIGRTGAAEFQVRYCEEDQPVIWIAAARWQDTWECAAATHPAEAVFRLCDQVVTGGLCKHCGRPAGFEPSSDTMPLDQHICWYQMDPSTKRFVRGCAQ